LQQNLIAKAGNYAQAEHASIKALGAGKIGDVEAEMIEAFKLHQIYPRILARLA
jgi:hypothetical protein